MKAMKNFVQNLTARVEKLSRRERIMIVGALLVAVLVPGYSLWIEPLQAREKQMQSRIAEARKQTQELSVQIAALAAQAKADPDSENREKAARLHQEIAELDSRLQAMTQGLVSPQDMPRVLEELLSRQRGLRLVRLENLPPQAVLNLATAPTGEKQRNVFRHGLRLEFEGSYLDALTYLQALENLPRRLLWDELTLEVIQHPRNRVSLVLHTLSLQEEWIGI